MINIDKTQKNNLIWVLILLILGSQSSNIVKYIPSHQDALLIKS